MKNGNYYLNEGIDESGIAQTHNPSYSIEQYQPFSLTPRRSNLGDYFEGRRDSKYDKYLGDIPEAYNRGETIEDLRASKQSGWDMLGNALANNLVIAGTTAVSGTLGLVDGIFESIVEGDPSKLWDNKINNWAVETQDRAREAMPIYRSKDYEESSLIGKLGSGIFWADLLQNLGYSEGMLIPGLGAARVLSSVPKIARGAASSLIASMGEASIEAISSRNDEVTNKTAIANQRYNELVQNASSPFALSVLNSQYTRDLDNIEKDATNAGNFVFGSNIALLTLSNNIEFGKLFSRGFGTSKRLKGALSRKGDVYSAPKTLPYMAKSVGKRVIDATTEGLEEVSQSAIANTPSNYSDYNTFNQSLFNPEVRQTVGNMWQALGQSYAETLQDPQTAEEFASGFLIGVIGVPVLKMGKFPIRLQNNAITELRADYADLKRSQDLANDINSRIENSDKIKSYYNGLVRHLAIQEDMNKAIDADDIFSFNNAESAQFISDIMMFDDAGDLSHLEDIIGKSIDYSDENIKNIINETSKKGEGPFMQNGNPMPLEEVKNILERTASELGNRIEEYKGDKTSLTTQFSDIDDDTLKNALFLKGQIRDHSRRLDNILDSNLQSINMALQDYIGDNINIPSKASLLKFLEDDTSKKTLEEALDNNSLPYDENLRVKRDIEDIARIQKNLKELNSSLKEILLDNGKSRRDKEKQEKDAVKTEEKKSQDRLRELFDSAASLKEVRDILESEENTPSIEEIQNIAKSGNQVAKDYIDMTRFNKTVQNIISSSNESSDIKQNAIKLLQNVVDNSNNLEEAINDNLEYISDPLIIYDNLSDENLKEFQEVQYVLTDAINKANKEEAFRKEFSDSKRSLIEKAGPNIPSTSNIGDSSIPIYEPPIGEATSAQISDENKQINEKVETPQSLDNKQKGRRPYYRPSIPELHIQASKEGDFRPFNVVAAEREKGVNFDEIYNYLRDSGAFTYINEGNLKVGDELGFMIDPEFNDHTIFIIDRRNNQIVGSLDESEYSVDRYEGLSDLEKKIRNEFVQGGDKTKKFIATPTTRVSQVMVGRIPYSTQERGLANIPNVTGEGKTPIFGIVKNGTLSTNDKLDDRLVTKPIDMSQKEGRMYLLIPNAAGKYSPAAVRVKHFNRAEFNPEDVEVQNTPMFRNIQSSINIVASSLSRESLNDAVKSLGSDLYIRDLHIDWFTSKSGNGIRFTKVQRDAQGNEVYEEKDGKRVRKETVKTVFLSTWDKDTLYSITGSEEVHTEPTLKNTADISKEITNILLDFNLPIQVNLGMLNRGGYNNMLINSGVLTSNITDARVISSWFTTDYFDIEGNLHQAISPTYIAPNIERKIETPVGGTEGAIPGIKVFVEGITYWADLNTGDIYNANNQIVHPANAKLIFDLAWAETNFGNLTNSSSMWGNKVLLPDNQILDRSTQKYLTGEAAKKVRDKISNREKTVEDTKKVIAQIAENQKKVDKTRTNGEFYYILEEDGQYHEYKRVHSVLGSNWVESKKQTEALKDIRVKLLNLIDNPAQYNTYLANLGKYYGIDFSQFRDRADAGSIDTIVNIVRSKMSTTNFQESLSIGNYVDSIVRNFFTSNDTPMRPSVISEEAFTRLISDLTEIRSNIETRGERFLTNNIVLFQKYSDGTRVAGEVDILSVDTDGNFRIYDVKTSKHSFYDFVDKYGSSVNYFKNKAVFQRISTQEYYTLQLSAYKNLFESQYNTPITTLAILPFVVQHNKGNVNSVIKEKGIMVTYNPAVNIPLSHSIEEESITKNLTPIFNSALEIQDPIDNVLPEYKLKDSKVGYFIRDGKLHKGYVTSIGQINGVEMYMTKVPSITKGFGRKDEQEHVAYNSYFAVFPNGNSIRIIENDRNAMTENQAGDTIRTVLKGNPQRVLDMSVEKTLISSPGITPLTGALKTIQAEQSIDEHNDEYEDDLDLDVLRKVDKEAMPVWNQEKELAWVKRVLPGLSDNNRIRVVKGLIKVARSGATAWGQFDQGIITLSDIAAEGTTYHEAFHAVFNLLLEDKERQQLYAEAKRLYGEKDDLSLEEDMAEGFREYVMTQDKRGLGTKLLEFFRSLFSKVVSWNKLRPSLIDYYRRINEGNYANRTFGITPINEMRSITSDVALFDTLHAPIQGILIKKGWTKEKFDSVSQEERNQAIKCLDF